jgi:1-acyl-sn-glycerol-3-phosphate acyltransferase
MATVYGLILSKLLGWKIKGEYPNINKSIIIFAPHTSYYDSVYGKLFLNDAGINHKFLSKKELFFFPFNIVMKWYGSIPVRGVKGENAIYLVAKMLDEKESLHIVISPEGQFAKTNKWNKGFYYMALKAKVPIIVGYLDYLRKEIGVKGVINNFESIESVMDQVNMMYTDVIAKYPEKFSLEQR